MPDDAGFGEFGDQVGILGGEVFGFGAVGFQVVELGIGAVVFAEEFPIATAEGEVGEVFVAVICIAVGWSAEVDGGLARGGGLAE